MKHLNPFKSYSIRKICDQYNIKNYTINKDGSIDVNGDVDLSVNELTEITLKFKNVSRCFNCSHNELISLKGSPERVINFFGYYNQLATLEGGPKYVSEGFWCNSNQLTSLKGCPEIIYGDFNCHDNQILTFEYFPKHLGGRFYCEYNPIYKIWKLFRDKTKIELFNDMDIIQDDVVILDRLNYFLEEIGKNTIKSISGYKYI